MDNKTSQLESGSIPPLLLKMAVPIIIAGIVSSLYQLVDAYFVTHYVGAVAMSGIAFSMPLFLLVMSVVVMVSSGGASFLSRNLGAKEHDKAEKMLGAIVSTGFVTSVLMAVSLYVFLLPIFDLLGATENILPYALEYTIPYLFAIPIFQLMHSTLEFFRVEGRTQILSIFVVASTIMNIALDAVFIIVLEMGVTGAIYATIASMAITLVAALITYAKIELVLKLRLSNLLPSFRDIFNIFKLGLPTFMGAMSATFAIGIINITITTYAADDADIMLGAFGVVYRVMMFVSAPIMGIAIALQTVAGYNYGAKLYGRVKESIVFACVFGTIASFALSLPMIVVPEIIYTWFSDEPLLITHASNISVLVFIGFLTKGISALAAPFFQVLGHTSKSFVLSLCQGFIVLVPMVLLFSYLYGIDGVMYAIPISDVIFLLIAGGFLVQQWFIMNKQELSEPEISEPEQPKASELEESPLPKEQASEYV